MSPYGRFNPSPDRQNSPFPDSTVTLTATHVLPLARLLPSWLTPDTYICSPQPLTGPRSPSFPSFALVHLVAAMARSDCGALVTLTLRVDRQRLTDRNPFSSVEPERTTESKTEIRLALLAPIAISGCACLRIVDKEREEVALAACEAWGRGFELAAPPRCFDSAILDQWFKRSMEPDLASYFFRDDAPGGDPRSIFAFGIAYAAKGGVAVATTPRKPADAAIARVSFEVWDKKASGRRDMHLSRRGVPSPKVTRMASVLEDSREVDDESVLEEDPQRCYESVNEALLALRDTYLQTLFSENVIRLLKFIATDLLISPSTLDQKYRVSSYAKAAVACADPDLDFANLPAPFDAFEARAVQSWTRRLLARAPGRASQEAGLGADRLAERIKEKLGGLKVMEAKLQIVFLLECLRIHTELGEPLHPLPGIPSQPSPKRSRPSASSAETEPPPRKKRKNSTVAKHRNHLSADEPTPPANLMQAYTTRVVWLMERLRIWTAVEGGEDERAADREMGAGIIGAGREGTENEGATLHDGFVQPVLVAFYEHPLPSIVADLVKLTATETAEPALAPTSPFFKTKHKLQRRGGTMGVRASVGSGMKGVKRGAAVAAESSAGANKRKKGKEMDGYLKTLRRREVETSVLAAGGGGSSKGAAKRSDDGVSAGRAAAGKCRAGLAGDKKGKVAADTKDEGVNQKGKGRITEDLGKGDAAATMKNLRRLGSRLGGGEAIGGSGGGLFSNFYPRPSSVTDNSNPFLPSPISAPIPTCEPNRSSLRPPAYPQPSLTASPSSLPLSAGSATVLAGDTPRVGPAGRPRRGSWTEADAEAEDADDGEDAMTPSSRLRQSPRRSSGPTVDGSATPTGRRTASARLRPFASPAAAAKPPLVATATTPKRRKAPAAAAGWVAGRTPESGRRLNVAMRGFEDVDWDGIGKDMVGEDGKGGGEDEDEGEEDGGTVKETPAKRRRS
ncbi:hypothetical protein BDK51DRAFT_37915 [Blyttiomyces helicus]|uniref:DNA replication regulator Sld3 C-terminal domain-containing protein n=1 Tax=Blyttiomyces helicus TaxID=388810 RepID=A0A4P9W8I2_9FUNG|nr:hypothetical protein BDK51DRAFT_37915 [Blyttiomyces helicus]|eukprot:RKO88839.1 hypothetical protein BDK51DRAFT_37915 [Blyttiomyces helicus]